MKINTLILFSLTLFSFTCFSAEIPRHIGPVVDLAGFLSKREQSLIAGSLYQLKNHSKIELQLLTIKSLEGEPIENFALKVAEKWGLGGKKNDKGVLFIISHNDRKMRIEVGQGLEGDLPDITTGRILNSIKPYLKKNDYRSGIILALSQIAKSAGGELNNQPRVKNRRSRSGKLSLLMFAFFFIVSFFGRGRGGGGGGLLSMLLLGGAAGYGRGRYDGCEGGFTGGGGFGGGGGGFSGGGASGDW